MYLANRIHKELAVRLDPEKFINTPISYAEISKILNSILAPLGAKARVVRAKNLNLYKTQIFEFSGYYDLIKKKNRITITLHVPSKKKEITFTKNKYNKFCFELSQVIQHEFIHHSQFQYRPEQAERKINVYYSNQISTNRMKNIEYLREWCEVEAWAHDIAMEINYFYHKHNPYSIVQNIDKYKKLYSYNQYKNTFRGTGWDKVKKSLLRKTVKWLSCAHVPTKA